MANNNQAASAETPIELCDVGALREECGTSWAVFAGVCAQAGWRPGKMLSRTDYEAAVKAFLSAPVNR